MLHNINKHKNIFIVVIICDKKMCDILQMKNKGKKLLKGNCFTITFIKLKESQSLLVILYLVTCHMIYKLVLLYVSIPLVSTDLCHYQFSLQFHNARRLRCINVCQNYFTCYRNFVSPLKKTVQLKQ